MDAKRLALSAACAVALHAANARAQQSARGGGLLDAPAPPTMPALAHRELTYLFEYTAARIEPNEPDGIAPASADGVTGAYAWFAHNDIEVPLVPRRWFAGIAADLAAASVPGVGTSFLLGNPEIYGRGVWSSVLGLSSGGGLGIVLPVPRDPSGISGRVLRTVRPVRPWDVAYFDDLTLTLRPSFDIRHVTGRFLFQLRQGIDFSVVLRELEGREARTRLTARATFFFGYRAAETVGLGLELFEVYSITGPELDDGERAAFTVSPTIRFMLEHVQPAIGALFPIATPLRGDVESYVGARLNVKFTWDVWGPEREP